MRIAVMGCKTRDEAANTAVEKGMKAAGLKVPDKIKEAKKKAEKKKKKAAEEKKPDPTDAGGMACDCDG